MYGVNQIARHSESSPSQPRPGEQPWPMQLRCTRSASILDLPAVDLRSSINAGTAPWHGGRRVGGRVLAGCLSSTAMPAAWLLFLSTPNAGCWLVRCRMLLTQEAKSPRAAQPYHNQSQPSTWCCTLLRPKGLSPVRLARFSALWQPPPASGGRSDPKQREDA